MSWRAGRGSRFGGKGSACALLAAVALSLSAGGCGGSGHSNGDVTLTIGARGTPEEEVLGHIYAQALRGAGYRVKEKFGIDPEYRESPLEDLRYGRISGFPEHMDAALSRIFGVGFEDQPNNPRRAYALAKAKFEKEGLTAFPPTPFSLSRPIGVTRKTAVRRHLRTISDLKGNAEEMRLLGFTDCHLSFDCLGGIERFYRIYFESISYLYTKSQLQNRYKALEDGEYDALVFYSTDGRLAGAKSKFVALEDDKHAFPLGNVIFVTRSEAVEEAGPDLEATIIAAQRALTLPVVQRLDAEVELAGKPPARVAAGYLRRVGLTE